MRALAALVASRLTMLIEHLSPKRADRVQLDTLRAQRSVSRADKAIRSIEAEGRLIQAGRRSTDAKTPAKSPANPPPEKK